MKYLLMISIFITASLSLFAQQTEIDSLKKEISDLQKRVKKLEKYQGPGYSDNYYEDIAHAFLVVGYHQGSYRFADSLDSVSNYGFTIQYGEDKVSILFNGAWGDNKFFSSLYIGYNFYGKNDNVAITPFIGGISWGNNFIDIQETIWSFGVSVTGIGKIPISLAYFKNQSGFGFNVGYAFNLTDM